jgi:multicomponent Na+:H+ antiporter subunit F
MAEHIIFGITIALILLILLSLYRLIFGPSILDRILSANIVGTKTTVLLLLIGILYQDLGMFVDLAVAYALLNFIATLGASKFFIRKKHDYQDEVVGGDS